MPSKKKISKIPKFKTYEEEALFWDTHSSEDFPEEFEIVQVQVRRPLRIRIAVPLEKSTVKELERISKEQGVEPTALARQWITERVASAGH
jgi:hypothetical protein